MPLRPSGGSGIAMGLILEGGRLTRSCRTSWATRITCGDMDFKVAGARGGHHLAADGHQDRRHHRGRSCGSGPRLRRRTAALTILGEMSKRHGRAARARRSASTRRSIETISIPTDKIREVIGYGRQGDPRDRLATTPAPRSTSTTTAWSRSRPRGRRQDQGRDRLDQVDHRRSRGGQDLRAVRS
ncbi:hypothetical protein ACRAWD_25715 [Caulobacter segnis]